MPDFIPDHFLAYGRPSIDEADIAAVVEVLKSDFLTTGPMVQNFEQVLSQQVEAKKVVACNSGTAALHLAYMALGLGPKDQIIVPAMTFSATANAAAFCGAEVIFADCDPKTGLVTVETVKEAIKRADLTRLKAISVVHLNGQIADIAGLYSLAKSHNLVLVEDACHALGSSYQIEGHDFEVGACAHSDLCCFSFHPVKTIAMGEGGAVTTPKIEWAEKMRALRNHGQIASADQFAALPRDAVSDAPVWHREMQMLGFNYRVPDILCALGVSQLKKLSSVKRQRQKLVIAYDEAFSSLFPMGKVLKKLPNQNPCWHLYPLRIDFAKLGKSREEVMQNLRAKNIGTQVHYMPVPWHPYWRDREKNGPDYVGARDYYLQALSLPLYMGLSDQEQNYVIDQVKQEILV